MATFQGFQALFSVLLLYFWVVVSSTNPTWCTQGSYSCDAGYVCCSNKCVLGSNCYDRYCTFDYDCSVGESCCNSQCKNGYNCIGQSCSVNSDCGHGGSFEYCCDGICSYDSCDTGYDAADDGPAVILGSVFGTIFIFSVFSVCIYYGCRRRRVHHGRVIVGQRVTTATVRTTTTTPQPYPPYVGQIPPPYQQGYQYYPPPQYEQHQTAVPPPYNPGTTATNDKPPPYSAATQRRSGGVYTPKPSYGAVQTASAPPPV